MRNKIVILVLGILLYCGGLAQAVPITIQISGNVTSASGSALPSTIHKDVTFTGTYTYESSTDDSGGGHYWHDAPYGITLSLGGYEFKTAPNHVGKFEIRIANDNPNTPTGEVWDSYSVHSEQNASTNSLWVGGISWNLRDSTHTAISSTALPLTAPVLSMWNSNYLEIYGGDAGVGYVNFYIGGTVTQATPEPLTGVLMAMGVLFFRRRR
jgi:hypothetical protein